LRPGWRLIITRDSGVRYSVEVALGGCMRMMKSRRADF